MKASVSLVIAGAFIALLAALNEHAFYAPYYLILPAAILGIVCVLVGCAGIRAGRAASRPTGLGERWRYYSVLMVTVLIGIAVGSLIFQRIYTDVPIEGRIIISVSVLFLAGAYFGWDVFFRRASVR